MVKNECRLFYYRNKKIIREEILDEVDIYLHLYSF